jgi:hypothetical protein
VQTGNVLKGETTVERFSKARRNRNNSSYLNLPLPSAKGKMSVLFLDQDYSQNLLVNCRRMICSPQTDSQQQLLSKTQQIYQARRRAQPPSNIRQTATNSD